MELPRWVFGGSRRDDQMKVLMIHCPKCNKWPLRVTNPEALHPASSDLIYVRAVCMKCGEKLKLDLNADLMKVVIDHE